jgi:hypothetical protein
MTTTEKHRPYRVICFLSRYASNDYVCSSYAGLANVDHMGMTLTP